MQEVCKNEIACIIGGFQVANGTTFLQNTNFAITKKGSYLVIFNASSQIPKDIDVTYIIFCNDNPISGAIIQASSPIDHSNSIIFPTSLSIIAYFNEGDKIGIQIDVVSGVITDSINIRNTILNIIKIS